MHTIESLSEEFRKLIEQEQAQIGDYCILLVSTRRGYSTNRHAYKSVEDLLNKAKTDEDYMKILHEIGWPNATILGCAIYCDCGLTENK